jgi:hypothetical protein
MAKLTDKERLTELRKIEALMAAQVKKETGAVVQLTCRSGDKWTMSGAPSDVEKGMAWIIGTGTATEDDRICPGDDGDGDFDDNLYVYFTTHPNKANAVGNAR